ncbi:LLGL scribble cell polarity complex component 2 [Leptonychotes weddellii]|uniref:LLGL scribble cell polarity complex component 2 n=1 Tax=Leptonychotes weddellii TaxID=9713 RepID=A0A7F8Q208_LEPWE|nr:LLGL scribble cell polarity complex component 2 [Leptonychotes weddellii]
MTDVLLPAGAALLQLLCPVLAAQLRGAEGTHVQVCAECFSLQTVEHGFPHQPSALGYSLSLRILAIGTRSGAIKLYGAPGVEFMGLHRENNAVVQIHFLPGQCQLVTLLDDNSLHLWSLKVKGSVSELQEDESFTLRGPPG